MSRFLKAARVSARNVAAAAAAHSHAKVAVQRSDLAAAVLAHKTAEAMLVGEDGGERHVEARQARPRRGENASDATAAEPQLSHKERAVGIASAGRQLAQHTLRRAAPEHGNTDARPVAANPRGGRRVMRWQLFEDGGQLLRGKAQHRWGRSGWHGGWDHV